MSTLVKLVRVRPATAGRAGTPAIPGTPPRPGYWREVHTPAGEGNTNVLLLNGEIFTEGMSPSVWHSQAVPAHWENIPNGVDPVTGEQMYSRIWVEAAPSYTIIPIPTSPAQTSKVWVPPSPGTPSVPAIPAIPPTPARQYAADWDAGAASRTFVRGDAEFTFSIPAGVVGVVCGLSTRQSGTGEGYESIEYAFHAQHGVVRPIEQGAFPSPARHNVGSNDVLCIARRGSTITYSIRGKVIRTVEEGTDQDLFARAELFAAHDSVEGAAFVSIQDLSSESTLAPLTALSVASSITPTASATGTLAPLSGAASAPVAVGTSAHGAGILAPLKSTSRASLSARRYTASAGTLRPLVGVISVAGSTNATGVKGVLRALVGVSATRPYTAVSGELHALQGRAANKTRVTFSTGQLHPLVGQASTKPYAHSEGVLHPLGGKARTAARIAPTFCFCAAELTPLTGAAVGLTGGVITVSGKLSKLTGVSSDRPYAEAGGMIFPLIGLSSDSPLTYGIGQLEMGTRFTLDAYAREQPPSSAAPTMPSPTLLAFAGATIEVASPTAGLIISGEFAVYGTAAMVSPTPTVLAAGTLTELGVVRAKSARVQLTAFGGGGAALSSPAATITGEATEAITGEGVLIPRYAPSLTGFAGAVLTRALFGPATITASATVGSVGTAQLLAPAPTLVATSSGGVYGVARLLLPMPEVKATPNRAALLMPRAWLLADGMGVPAQVSGAWVFGISPSHAADPANPRAEDGRYGAGPDNHPASRYLNFPFLHIVRRNGDYYGISPTGIYRLGGDTDAGAPIAWEVETAVNDFGSVQLKGMTSAYFGAHLGPSAKATAIVGERGSNQYPYPNVRGVPIQNHRVMFGRGMRSRYYGVRIDDASGGELHMGSIDLAVVNLTRKI